MTQAVPYGELVDLRSSAAESAPKQANERALAALRRLEARLSLRDPLSPARHGIARACNVTAGRPSIRLACPAHVSWGYRDEPRRERNCKRTGQLATSHDSGFLG